MTNYHHQPYTVKAEDRSGEAYGILLSYTKRKCNQVNKDHILDTCWSVQELMAECFGEACKKAATACNAERGFRKACFNPFCKVQSDYEEFPCAATTDL